MKKYQCISCRSIFENEKNGKYTCQRCGEEYDMGEKYLKTFFDKKLFNSYRKDYLLNKTLNNNGYMSYQFLKEGSISLPDREDVKRFCNFIKENYCGRVILDVGCGVMNIPGYLMLDNRNELELIGIDPIDDNNFDGLRIVGCSEFVPLTDDSVNTIIFATSMDHVCNLRRTVQESHRLLSEKGKVLVWMSDRSMSILNKTGSWIHQKLRSWKLGYPVNKYYVYENWTVLGVPPGGVDPFHSYHETPKKIVKIFNDNGFQLLLEKKFSRNEVFLCLEKI